MQIFLPCPDRRQSLEALDKKRLNKQNVETFQILKSLRDPNYGFKHHPAKWMVWNHGSWLLEYLWIGLEVAENHGIETAKMHDNYQDMNLLFDSADRHVAPNWFGQSSFHRSHQSNLYRKDPEHYAAFSEVGPDLKYVWPLCTCRNLSSH